MSTVLGGQAARSEPAKRARRARRRGAAPLLILSVGLANCRLALPGAPGTPGLAPSTWDIAANVGLVELKLGKLPAVPTATASATGTAPPPPPRSAVPAIILGGAAVVGAAVGAGLIAGSRAEYDKTAALGDAIRGTGATCKVGAPGFDARCAEAESAANASNALKAGSIVGFVVAGAAATGAVLSLLWPTSKPAHGQVHLTPVASRDASWLIVSGSF